MRRPAATFPRRLDPSGAFRGFPQKTAGPLLIPDLVFYNLETYPEQGSG
jgi:hypothetical protein